MTVTVRISGQVKLLKERKGIGDWDSEKEWTSKTVERIKGIGDCDNKKE